MANEINLQTQLSAKKGLLSVQRAVSVRADLAGDQYAGGAQSIGFAAHEAVNMGDVSAAGCFIFLNTDPANYVEVGIDVSGTFYPFIKLLPGESSAGRLGTNAPYAKANTAAVVLDFTVLEA